MKVTTVLRETAIAHRSETEASEIVLTLHPGEIITVYCEKSDKTQWVSMKLPTGKYGFMRGIIVRTDSHNFEFNPARIHYTHENIRVGIVHQETRDRTVEHPVFPLMTNNTVSRWTLLRKPPFVWNINRPKTGESKLTIQCPYCSEQISAIIFSTDQMNKLRQSFAKRSKRGTLLALTIFITVMAIHALCYLLFPAWVATFPSIMIFLGIYFLSILIPLMMVKSVAGPLGGRIDLQEEPLNERIGGHYIAWIESE